MIFVVRGWQRQQPALPGVPESLLTGIASGLRFVRHSAPMRAIVLRNLTFALCASSLYALLPVIARDQLQLGAGGFGVLFGSFGAGAVVGRAEHPPARCKHSLQRMVVAASLLWVISATLVAATDTRRSHWSARSARARPGWAFSRASAPGRKARRRHGCARAPWR